VDHVSIRQQSQQLAGEAVVPYDVVGCCEVDVHSSSLLFNRKAILIHRLDSCLLTSLVDSRPPVLCALFFMSCEAMGFAKTGHRQEERPDLPVSLLIVLHALRLECEKSM